METNRMESIGHQLKGALKEKFGKFIGDGKLTRDGAAERALGDAQTSGGKPLVAGIDADRITGVGHQIKGAGEQALGRLMGDAKMMANGSAEISAGKAQNEAGSARDEARQANQSATAQTAASSVAPDEMAADRQGLVVPSDDSSKV